MVRTAILVDGGFYRKRASFLWGHKTPEARAKELYAYCTAHIKDSDPKYSRFLYRVFYYDCPPLDDFIFHPLKGNIDLSRSDTNKWTKEFFNHLKQKRKFALRMGKISNDFSCYQLTSSALKKLCSKKITIDELQDTDFVVSFIQKGVDMKIGLDIASLAHKKQVDQIILISGDSDFVPAAKHARREGIDFILDPMGTNIKDDLFEHIDGLKSPWKNMKSRNKQP